MCSNLDNCVLFTFRMVEVRVFPSLTSIMKNSQLLSCDVINLAFDAKLSILHRGRVARLGQISNPIWKSGPICIRGMSLAHHIWVPGVVWSGFVIWLNNESHLHNCIFEFGSLGFRGRFFRCFIEWRFGPWGPNRHQTVDINQQKKTCVKISFVFSEL